MNSKERMLLAINREKPDRLPVTIHQWQQYHLDMFMGGMTDIQANRAVGLDASVNYYQVLESESPDWRIETETRQHEGSHNTRYKITTPGGILTVAEDSNPMTTWATEHLIKNPEDILLLKKYQPVPRFDRQGAVRAYEELGDCGILRTFLFGKQGGCWQDACELYGVENLILATYDDPEWVHQFLGILLEQKLKYIDDNLTGLPIDLVETGGGAASNTVISPALHKEFCLPYDQAIHDALHAAGHKVVYHTCGGMMKILSLIIENRCDVSETLTPKMLGGDIGTDSEGLYVRNTLRPHIGIIGGMDQINILGSGSRRQIEDEVHRLFRIFGEDGGYICSASDHFFNVPRQNLEYFAEAAKACRY